MIGCLRTRVRKQPIIALYFGSETVFKFHNLEAWDELGHHVFCLGGFFIIEVLERRIRHQELTIYSLK